MTVLLVTKQYHHHHHHTSCKRSICIKIQYFTSVVISILLCLSHRTTKTSINGVYAIDHSTSTTTTTNITCRFILNDVSYDPDAVVVVSSADEQETKSNNNNNKDEFYACQPVMIRANHMIVQSHMYLIDDDIIPDTLKDEISNIGHNSYVYVEIQNAILQSSTARVVQSSSSNSVPMIFTVLNIMEQQNIEKDITSAYDDVTNSYNNTIVRRNNELLLYPPIQRQIRERNRQQRQTSDYTNDIVTTKASLRQTVAMNVIILRVVAKDSEPTSTINELYDLTFSITSSRSLRSQMLKCSNGQLYIQPAMGGVGIIDVPIDVYAHELSNSNNDKEAGEDQSPRHVLINAAYEAAPKILRDLARSQLIEHNTMADDDIVSDSTIRSKTKYFADIDPDTIEDVRDVTDLVMVIVPPITADKNWAAFGTVNGAASVYNDQWGSYLGATMHEIGHNLGLYHANVDTVEYKDRTGYMGSAPKIQNFPAKCYNAQNHNELQWFNDKTVHILSKDFQSQVIKVAAFVYYSKLSSNDKYEVLITIDDQYYMQYNRAVSYNNETSEHPDTLVIVKNAYKGTERIAQLDSTDDSFKIDATHDNANDIYIRVCSQETIPISSDTEDTFDYIEIMTISLSTNNNELIDLCTRSNPPTPSPTITPTSLSPTIERTIEPSISDPTTTTSTKSPVGNDEDDNDEDEDDDNVVVLPPLNAPPVNAPTSVPVVTSTSVPITLPPSEIIIDSGHNNSTDGGFIALQQMQKAEAKEKRNRLIIILVSALIGLLVLVICLLYRRRRNYCLKKTIKMSENLPSRGFFRINTAALSFESDVKENQYNDDDDYDGDSITVATTSKSNTPETSPTSNGGGGGGGLIPSGVGDPFEAATSMLNMICINDRPETTSSLSDSTPWTSFIMSVANHILDLKPDQKTSQALSNDHPSRTGNNDNNSSDKNTNITTEIPSTRAEAYVNGIRTRTLLTDAELPSSIKNKLKDCECSTPINNQGIVSSVGLNTQLVADSFLAILASQSSNDEETANINSTVVDPVVEVTTNDVLINGKSEHECTTPHSPVSVDDSRKIDSSTHSIEGVWSKLKSKLTRDLRLGTDSQRSVNSRKEGRDDANNGGCRSLTSPSSIIENDGDYPLRIMSFADDEDDKMENIIVPNDSVDAIVSVLQRARSGDVINTFPDGFTTDDDDDVNHFYDDDNDNDDSNYYDMNDEYVGRTSRQQQQQKKSYYPSKTNPIPVPTGKLNIASILLQGPNRFLPTTTKINPTTSNDNIVVDDTSADTSTVSIYYGDSLNDTRSILDNQLDSARVETGRLDPISKRV